jgi:hypothetical protein
MSSVATERPKLAALIDFSISFIYNALGCCGAFILMDVLGLADRSAKSFATFDSPLGITGD